MLEGEFKNLTCDDTKHRTQLHPLKLFLDFERGRILIFVFCKKWKTDSRDNEVRYDE